MASESGHADREPCVRCGSRATERIRNGYSSDEYRCADCDHEWTEEKERETQGPFVAPHGRQDIPDYE